jgi:hypothetical protein
MGIDSGSFSTAFTNSTMFDAGPGGGGAFDYFNPGPNYITDLAFDTTIQMGLTQLQIDTAYNCNAPNAFFTNCSFTYTPSDGSLVIRFFEADETESFGVEQFDGIPPLPPGCSNKPDGEGCQTGHFIVTLNNGYAPTGDNGGWTPGEDFGVAEINGVASVPEPASVLLLLGVAGWLAVKRRRRPA